MYNKKEIIHSLFTINYSKEMEKELRKTIGEVVSLPFILDSVKYGVCANSIIVKISQIAPICYKIGDKVFLKGETKGKYDLVGDGLSDEKLTELFDMTEEMKSGNSYSFYVSSTAYFDFATCEEIIEVKRFLAKL